MNSLGKTNFIINNKIKEATGILIDSQSENHIVSSIAKQYNFTKGINYEFPRKFGETECYHLVRL